MPITETQVIISQNKYGENGEIIIIRTKIQSMEGKKEKKSLNVMLILSLSFQSSQGFFFLIFFLFFHMIKIVIFSKKLF